MLSCSTKEMGVYAGVFKLLSFDFDITLNSHGHIPPLVLMDSIEERLRKKLSAKDFELASEILKTPTPKIRNLIEDKMNEALKG